MFNELKLRSVVMCFASLIAVDDASAGWFGPSTYNECVLAEMKGQREYMMDTVIADCEAKFCTVREYTPEELAERERTCAPGSTDFDCLMQKRQVCK